MKDNVKPASGCTGPGDCYVFPVFGNPDLAPIGAISISKQVADEKAYVCCNLGTTLYLDPTIIAAGGATRFVSFNLRHNASLTLSDECSEPE